jgi:hypothetical protein
MDQKGERAANTFSTYLLEFAECLSGIRQSLKMLTLGCGEFRLLTDARSRKPRTAPKNESYNYHPILPPSSESLMP